MSWVVPAVATLALAPMPVTSQFMPHDTGPGVNATLNALNRKDFSGSHYDAGSRELVVIGDGFPSLSTASLNTANDSVLPYSYESGADVIARIDGATGIRWVRGTPPQVGPGTVAPVSYAQVKTAYADESPDLVPANAGSAVLNGNEAAGLIAGALGRQLAITPPTSPADPEMVFSPAILIAYNGRPEGSAKVQQDNAGTAFATDTRFGFDAGGHFTTARIVTSLSAAPLDEETAAAAAPPTVAQLTSNIPGKPLKTASAADSFPVPEPSAAAVWLTSMGILLVYRKR